MLLTRNTRQGGYQIGLEPATVEMPPHSCFSSVVEIGVLSTFRATEVRLSAIEVNEYLNSLLGHVEFDSDNFPRLFDAE